MACAQCRTGWREIPRRGSEGRTGAWQLFGAGTAEYRVLEVPVGRPKDGEGSRKEPASDSDTGWTKVDGKPRSRRNLQAQPTPRRDASAQVDAPPPGS